MFVHFDRQGIVHDFVLHYLAEIAQAGFTTVFVSNAPRLDPESIDRIASLCGAIVQRANVGMDFGAYKDGIQTLPRLDRLEALLLANDSVYGPFHDLGDVIGRMNLAETDVWGITDSWERRFHLQSYFLLFGRRALSHEAFAQFWSRLRYVQAKSWVIGHYEIGLTPTPRSEWTAMPSPVPVPDRRHRAAARQSRADPRACLLAGGHPIGEQVRYGSHREASGPYPAPPRRLNQASPIIPAPLEDTSPLWSRPFCHTLYRLAHHVACVVGKRGP